MKDFTLELRCALVSVHDRKMYDDKRSKVSVEGLFRSQAQIEDNYIIRNKENKRYILRVEDIEEFERFYNFVQDLVENYGDYAIFHLKDGRFENSEYFRTILGLHTNDGFKRFA